MVLDRVLDGLGRTSPNALPAGDHMLSFRVGVLMGASRFLHPERVHADAPWPEMFGSERFWAPSTSTHCCQSCTRQMREDVCFALGRWALGLLAPLDQGYTLDLASTVLERFGLRPASVLKPAGKRHTLETLRHTLFTGAAVRGSSGRNRVLRLSASDAWRMRFHAVLTRLLVPISNCKAEQDEGPLLALMA